MRKINILKFQDTVPHKFVFNVHTTYFIRIMYYIHTPNTSTTLCLLHNSCLQQVSQRLGLIVLNCSIWSTFQRHCFLSNLPLCTLNFTSKSSYSGIIESPHKFAEMLFTLFSMLKEHKLAISHLVHSQRIWVEQWLSQLSPTLQTH